MFGSSIFVDMGGQRTFEVEFWDFGLKNVRIKAKLTRLAKFYRKHICRYLVVVWSWGYSISSIFVCKINLSLKVNKFAKSTVSLTSVTETYWGIFMISPHLALEVAYSYKASVRGVPWDTYYFVFHESLKNSTPPVDVSTWTILAWLLPYVIMNTFDHYDVFVNHSVLTIV